MSNFEAETLNLIMKESKINLDGENYKKVFKELTSMLDQIKCLRYIDTSKI